MLSSDWSGGQLSKSLLGNDRYSLQELLDDIFGANKNRTSWTSWENDVTVDFSETTAVLVLQAHRNMIQDGGRENSHFWDVDILTSR